MKILVLYYSKYGHTLKMAQAVQQGVQSIQGVEVILRRAPEFPEDQQQILNDKYAKPVWDAQKDIEVCKLDDFREMDGLVLGSPTRYGNMAAQLKRVIDSTASLWLEGAFESKPAGLFTSTASTHGGQETTLLTMMPLLLHMGMIIVGVPYSVPGMLHTQGRGGTPYGASTVAGHDNTLQPAPEDLEIAKALGKRVAHIACNINRK